jgi:CheY-like chemotaxis protein
MIPRVLIVDPDQALLETVRSFFDRYGRIFQLSDAATAADGALALNNEAFSLLVVDADISLANGPPFLEYVTRRYPLLPVIVTGRPEALNPYAQEVGRRYLACLRKPFEANRLAERILVAVDWEADGGTLHEVSTFIVPQMIEIEKKTCAVKVTRLSSCRHGILFFSEGALVEALCDGQTGEAAAYTILSWDKVKIVINNSCSVTERRIHSPSNAILLQAMRLRDESEEKEASEGGSQDSPGERWQDTKPEKVDSGTAPSSAPLSARVQPAPGRDTCLKTLATTPGVEDVYQDDTWDALMAASDRVGRALNVGAPKLVLVSGDQLDSDVMLLPADRTVVVTVDKLSRRDDMIETVLKAIPE